MKNYVLLLSFFSPSAFANSSNLSGTFVSQCEWSGLSSDYDHAMKVSYTFSENKVEVKKSFYLDSLCLHESVEPEVASGVFTIGEKVSGISYGEEGKHAYRISMQIGSESFDGCFLVNSNTFEDKQKSLYFSDSYSWNSHNSEPCTVNFNNTYVQ